MPRQVWWVDFGHPTGHEQGGQCPAIVVGSATHCRFPIDMAVVVPLTTRNRGLEALRSWPEGVFRWLLVAFGGW